MIVVVACLLAGIASGPFGVGGSVIIAPALRFLAPALHWLPSFVMHMAAATSVAAILPTSIASAHAHRRQGTVDAAIVRRRAPPMVLRAPVGARPERRLPAKTLRRLSGLFLIAVAVALLDRAAR